MPRRKASWALIVWTVLFAIWASVGITGNDCGSQKGDQYLSGHDAQTACAAGTGIGVALILVLWFIGFIGLSILWFLTRNRNSRDCAVCGKSAESGVVQCKSCGDDLRQGQHRDAGANVSGTARRGRLAHAAREMRKSRALAAVVGAVAVGACGGSSNAGSVTTQATRTPAQRVSVKITDPHGGASVKPRLTVRGIVSPRSATIDVNGKPASVHAGRFRALVLLKKGDARLQATAAAHGATDQSGVTVRRLPTTAEKRAAARQRQAKARTRAATDKNADDSDGSFVMPSEVGMDLQEAQDDIQRASGDPLFVSHSRDATGADRLQILDRDWKVCSQNVPSGERVSAVGHIVFYVVKDGESCP